MQERKVFVEEQNDFKRHEVPFKGKQGIRVKPKNNLHKTNKAKLARIEKIVAVLLIKDLD